MSITYQQAKRIRGTKLTDLISDQIMYEQSIAKGIKKGISLKIRGKVKGITEKFDPLNIAKFLTFGSSLGPALLGHMLGRDAKDIQYFSGRFKPIRENKIRADKIKPLPKEDVVGDLNGILTKMYKLMSTTHENELRRKELSDNKMEEMEMERERRHQEVLNALELLTGKKIKRKATRVVPTNTGVGAGTVAAAVALGAGAATAASVAAKAVPAMMRMFLLSPLGLYITAGAALLSLLYNDEKPEETTKQILGAGDPAAVSTAIMEASAETSAVEKKKMRILADRPKNKKSYLFWRDKEMQDKYLEEIGWDQNTGTTADERQRGVDHIDTEGRNVTKLQPAGTPQPELQFDADKRGVSGKLIRQNSNAGQKLDEVQKQNLDVKIAPKPKTPPSTTNNTNVNTSQLSTPVKKPLPDVRNHEDSFERMIFESTRVV
jgi:hypothetical protein